MTAVVRGPGILALALTAGGAATPAAPAEAQTAVIAGFDAGPAFGIRGEGPRGPLGNGTFVRVVIRPDTLWGFAVELHAWNRPGFLTRGQVVGQVRHLFALSRGTIRLSGGGHAAVGYGREELVEDSLTRGGPVLGLGAEVDLRLAPWPVLGLRAAATLYLLGLPRLGVSQPGRSDDAGGWREAGVVTVGVALRFSNRR
jgi:hypothetical protein